MNRFYRTAANTSFFAHAALIFCVFVIGFLKGCFKPKEIIIPLDMTVVIEENLAPPDKNEKDEPNEPEEIAPPPPKPVKTITPPAAPIEDAVVLSLIHI